MTFRQLISFFSATLLGLSSVSAYISEHLGGGVQVETAILLREDGTPRCWIGMNPSEYLTAEKLDQFYREGLEIDTLRECDQGDELYAIAAHGSEEISHGVAMPPLSRAVLLNISAGFLGTCLFLKNPTVLNNVIMLGSIALAGGFSGVILRKTLELVPAAFFPITLGLAGAINCTNEGREEWQRGNDRLEE